MVTQPTGAVTWRKGFPSTFDPEVFRAEYDRLYKQHGYNVDAELVVNAATPKGSPIHGVFEWDDQKAGHEYRLSQARDYLVAIRVNITGGKLISSRYLVSVQARENEAKSYIPVSAAMADKYLREQVLAQALKELAAFQAKYQELTELAEIFRVTKRVIRKHQTVR